MRNRWEAGAQTDLDEPATITERQLRSLRGGARAGRLAVLLALLSTLAAGWGLLMGSDALAGVDGIQGVRQKVLSAIGQGAPTESSSLPASAPDRLGGTNVPVAPDSVSAAESALPPPPTSTETRTSQRDASGGR